MKRYYFILLFAALSGCLSSHSERASSVDPSGWGMKDTVRVEFPNRDTVGTRTLDVFIRVNQEFTGDSLPLTIITTAPDGCRWAEDFTVYPRFRVGNRDSFAEQSFPYRFNSVLGREGTYLFEIVPRLDGIRGITAVGLAARAE